MLHQTFLLSALARLQTLGIQVLQYDGEPFNVDEVATAEMEKNMTRSRK
jgi:hypothetical protein